MHDRDAREMRVGDEANRGLRSEQCVENCGDAVDPAPVSKRLGATAMSALRKERRRPEVAVPRCGVVAVLHRAAVVDEGSAGIEGRQFVALPRTRRRCAGGRKTRAQQRVDLVPQPGSALVSAVRERGGNITVKGQRRAHDPILVR